MNTKRYNLVVISKKADPLKVFNYPKSLRWQSVLRVLHHAKKGGKLAHILVFDSINSLHAVYYLNDFGRITKHVCLGWYGYQFWMRTRRESQLL